MKAPESILLKLRCDGPLSNVAFNFTLSRYNEAVGVIGNLVHSSTHIKRRVLDEGALQPVIGLLSSQCPESQREAALLLGQFATTEPEYKAGIAGASQFSRVLQMAVNGAQICDLEETDGQICHAMVQYGDSTSNSQELATAI